MGRILVRTVIWGLFLFSAFISGALLRYYISQQLAPVSTIPSFQEVHIEKGMSQRQIAQLLKARNLIRDEMFFVYYAKLNGLEGRLKSGDYLLSPHFSTVRIVEKLVRGEIIPVTFTIPEGLTNDEVGERLEKYGVMTKKEFDTEIRKSEYLSFRGENLSSLEGFLFPDTYIFRKGVRPSDVIRAMLKRFEEVLPQDATYLARQNGLSLKEVVTLASIVEKEARVDSERPRIAGVFLNRLAKGMKLESCATVQYALPERKERLLESDLKLNSPYNTYLFPGLPPGPICNPGEKSLKAALKPEIHDYLYFVSNGDGTHTFSKTFEEHLRAKKKNSFANTTARETRKKKL